MRLGGRVWAGCFPPNIHPFQLPCLSIGCKSHGYIEKRVVLRYFSLVDLLLLVHAQLTRAHVDQEEQTTTGIR